MEKLKFIEELKKFHKIIGLSEFGSYNTKDWIKNRSDIDIAVVMAPSTTFMDTLEVEDDLVDLLIEYYKYEKIHLTFILYKDFANKFARIAIESKNLYITNEERWFDFEHSVRKYFRNNYEFEKKMKIHEQYELFGGIIDESLL